MMEYALGYFTFACAGALVAAIGAVWMDMTDSLVEGFLGQCFGATGTAVATVSLIKFFGF